MTLDAAAAVYFAREIEGVCNDDAMALRWDFNSAVRSGTRAFLRARILQLGRYGSGQQPDAAKHFKNLLPLQKLYCRRNASKPARVPEFVQLQCKRKMSCCAQAAVRHLPLLLRRARDRLP